MHSTDRPGTPRRYTYLLSLWQEGSSWRAALRPAEGGLRLGFGDLEQLVAFLLRLQDDLSASVPPVARPAWDVGNPPVAVPETSNLGPAGEEQQQ